MLLCVGPAMVFVFVSCHACVGVFVGVFVVASDVDRTKQVQVQYYKVKEQLGEQVRWILFIGGAGAVYIVYWRSMCGVYCGSRCGGYCLLEEQVRCILFIGGVCAVYTAGAGAVDIVYWRSRCGVYWGSRCGVCCLLEEQVRWPPAAPGRSSVMIDDN